MRERAEPSVFATKSVSQPISTSTPMRPFPCTYASMTPSLVVRSAREAIFAIPRSRSSLTAASASPVVSARARLQSMMPAPVISRRS